MSSGLKSTISPKKNLPPIIGYVHNLSKVRQGPKRKWFEMKLQTASGRVRAVCFSKDKYSIFAEKEKTITAIFSPYKYLPWAEISLQSPLPFFSRTLKILDIR